MEPGLKVKSVSPPVGQNSLGTEPFGVKSSMSRTGKGPCPVGWAAARWFRKGTNGASAPSPAAAPRKSRREALEGLLVTLALLPGSRLLEIQGDPRAEPG